MLPPEEEKFVEKTKPLIFTNDFSPVKEFQTCLDYEKINKMAEEIVLRNTQED